MALDPFATATDVATRLGQTFDATQTAQVNAFLDDASGLVRDYLRQEVSLVVDDVMNRTSPSGAWLVLPQLPVESVSLVSVNGQAVGDYSLIGNQLYRVFGWQWPSVNVIPPNAIYGLQSTVSVTYTHGYTEIPATIRSTTITMVIRCFTNIGGSRSVSLDDYSETWPSAAVGTAVFMSDADKASIKRYRNAAQSIEQGTGVW